MSANANHKPESNTVLDTDTLIAYASVYQDGHRLVRLAVEKLLGEGIKPCFTSKSLKDIQKYLTTVVRVTSVLQYYPNRVVELVAEESTDPLVKEFFGDKYITPEAYAHYFLKQITTEFTELPESPESARTITLQEMVECGKKLNDERRKRQEDERRKKERN